MIVASRKNIRELKEFLAPYDRIAVLGCGTCVTVCLAGGEREAGMTASALRMAYRIDGVQKDIRDLTIERQCDDAFIDEAWKSLDEADAILSLACGAGVQAIAERFPKKPVFPGVDTQFIGILEEQGVWAEKCIACGHCRIGSFGGICPVTRCAKHLLNGPCGSSHDGKCEVNPDVDCAWQLIYDRLKAIGEEYRLMEIAPLPDWSLSNEGGCRKIVREDQRI
jgi:ferredoxin